MKKESNDKLFAFGIIIGLFLSFIAILLEPNLQELLSAKLFEYQGINNIDIEKALESEKQILHLEKRISDLKVSFF